MQKHNNVSGWCVSATETPVSATETRRYEQDLTALLAGWLARGYVKTLWDIEKKRMLFSIRYPVYHLLPAARRLAKKIKNAQKNKPLETKQQTNDTENKEQALQFPQRSGSNLRRKPGGKITERKPEWMGI